MLVLVGGPTGIGKTTLIAALAADGGCRVVHTVTTRPARPGDRFKTSLTEDEYHSRRNSLLWPAQRLYGAFYGEDYAEAMTAACPLNDTPWLIDAAPETLVIFDHVPHRRLILLPAERDFLPRALAAANRLERLEKARLEVAEWRRTVAAVGAPAAVGGTVEVPCRWGRQAEIAAFSRRALEAWRSPR